MTNREFSFDKIKAFLAGILSITISTMFNHLNCSGSANSRFHQMMRLESF